MKVVVAGGGIGGLATALAFVQRGWEAVVFEQAARLEEVGAGVQISPNAMKALAALDLADVAKARGFAPEALEMRDGRSGAGIFSLPAGAAAQRRWGAPYVNLHRADLVDLLADALERRAPGALRLSTKAAGYRTGVDGAALALDGGGEEEGSLVVAADGVRSVLRAQMLGPDGADFTGNVAWRAVAPVEALDPAPPPTACVWVGPGRHAVTYRLRGGALANMVGVVERGDWTSESWTEPGAREDALADFAGWRPEVLALLSSAAAHFRWALFDRKPAPRWSEGRIALLGDAAHPMLPFMAQGAAMALEDAVILAGLAHGGRDDIPAALQRYYRMRIGRASAVWKASRRNRRLFHLSAPLERAAAYGALRAAGAAAPGLLLARQDAIYGYDPREAAGG